MIDILERIATALETIAYNTSVSETHIATIRAMRRFGVRQGDNLVGAYVCITFDLAREVLPRDFNLYVKHPTDPHQTTYGNKMLDELGALIDKPDRYSDLDLIGKQFQLVFEGRTILEISRPEWMRSGKFDFAKSAPIDAATQEGVKRELNA
jgi:hypothetical protein